MRESEWVDERETYREGGGEIESEITVVDGVLPVAVFEMNGIYFTWKPRPAKL